MALEVLERNRDAILLNDPVQLIDEARIQLVDWWTLLLWVAAVVHADFLVGVVELPGLTLVLIVEVNNEQWVLEIDEKVPHIRHFLRLLLVFNDVESGISPFMVLIDLILELFLGVSAWNVFNAKVGPEIKALFDQVNSDWLVIACLIIRLRVV